MERVAYLTEGDTLDAGELVFVLSPDQVPTTIALDQPLAEATRQFQIDYIRSHIQSSHGNMTEAARRLGLHRSNLYRKMRQLDMTPDETP
jgi:Nif-specific regulatory protein